MHLTPDQIVDEVRRKIVDETGIPPSSFPNYVLVMVRLSVLGILAYLNRAGSVSPAP